MTVPVIRISTLLVCRALRCCDSLCIGKCTPPTCSLFILLLLAQEFPQLCCPTPWLCLAHRTFVRIYATISRRNLYIQPDEWWCIYGGKEIHVARRSCNCSVVSRLIRRLLHVASKIVIHRILLRSANPTSWESSCINVFFLLLGEDVFTSAVDMIRSSNVHGPPAPITETVSVHDVVGLQEGRALFLQ